MDFKWILDKRLIVIPIVLILISLFSIGYQYATTGELMEKSIELKGGNLITVTTDESVSQKDVEALLAGKEVSVRILGGLANGMTIGTSENPQEILDIVKTRYTIKGSSIETVGPLLGDVFWKQARLAFVVAFAVMSLTVFVLFRKVAPSLSVIAAGATNILMTVAFMNIFSIELSLATLAALLLLIGYSVDTNILLTAHAYKTGQVFEEGTLSAFKTAITTTATTIVALMAIFVTPTSHVLNSIALVLVMGLIFDLVNTWVTNINLLRWLR